MPGSTPIHGNDEYLEFTVGKVGGFPVRYFRKKGVVGKPVGVLRLAPHDGRGSGTETIPVRPVEFSKAELRDNAAGILQRLEKRVSSMEDQIKQFETDADAG